MPFVVQVQHSIPYFTGIPEDVVTNVMHFRYEDVISPSPEHLDDLRDAVKDFFNQLYGGISGSTATMAKFMRPALARQKMYLLADTPPRVPVLDEVVPLTGLNQDATTSRIPTEVSVCVSFHGTYVGGENRQSKRGRIFLGGLGDGWLAAGSAGDFPIPAGDPLNRAKQACINLKAATDADDWTWLVWSPTLGTGSAVVAGWIDNAFDTQRRRGNAATARTAFP
jgi:hypothetical protein